MQNEQSAVFTLARRLCELRSERRDAECILKEINAEIAAVEYLVDVFKRRNGGGGCV